MSEEFNKIMLRFTTPENAEILNQAYDLLTDLNSTEHQSAINSTFMIADDLDGPSILTSVDAILFDELEHYLEQHQVFTNVERIEQLFPFVYTLATFDSYGDPVTIMDIIKANDTPEDVLIDLLPLFDIVDQDEYRGYLESVGPELIDKMTQIMEFRSDALIAEGFLDEGDGLLVTMDIIRTRVRAYVAANPGSLIASIIADGYPLGLSIDDYLKDSKAFLLTLSASELITQLTGVVLASDVVDDRIVITIKQLTEQLLSGVDNDKLSLINSIIETAKNE